MIVTKKSYLNRYYINKKLLTIFGPKSNKILSDTFFFSGSDVGGPCDIYEQVYHRPDKVLTPESKCVGGKQASRFPMYGKQSNLRTSAIIKTCVLLTDNEDFVSYSYDKAVDPILLAYEKFYPFHQAERYYKSVNIYYGKKPITHLEKYKKSLLSFCLSPNWQQL